MIPTGSAYRKGLRDGREVWTKGERVRDVTAHSALEPIIDVRARTHDVAFEAAPPWLHARSLSGEQWMRGI